MGISMVNKNLTNINFANIDNQVTFIDTIKCFQQSLAVLANTMTDREKQCLKNESKKFIRKDLKLTKKFEECSIDDQEWVLNCLPSAKGVIPY